MIREASGYRGRVADQEGVRPGGANHIDGARDEPTARNRDRVAVGAAWVAAALGIASAATSAYWAFGGTALLDTVGGEIERWGRERGPAVAFALAGIVLVKLVVAVAAPILVGIGHPPAWMAGRVPRILGWIAATVLIGYGGVLTVAGLLVQTGALTAAPDADRTAIAWHAWLWDPWFLVWGIAFAIALRRSRPARTA